MARPFADKSWLATLVDEAIAAPAGAAATPSGTSHDPDFALAARGLVVRSLRTRLPAVALEGPEGFREIVLQHVLLVLELRRLSPRATGPERARAEVAAFLAGALDQPALALEAANEPASRRQERAVERALVAAGEELRERGYPPGDPLSGLPLHSGGMAIFRRQLARVAGGFARNGRLEREALERHAEFATQELLLLSEALSGLLGSAAAPSARAELVRARQMARLGLRGRRLREARRRVEDPRSPEALAAATPPAVAGFLFEQLLLAQLRTRLDGEGASRFAEAFAQAAQLGPEVVMAAQVEAAAQSGDPQAWFGRGNHGSIDWHAFTDDFGAAADHMVERVSVAVTENLGALATELRETGELGALLTKAAAGQRLTAEEKRKVRAQLLDLAKAVPALAVFAAPGGALLLPILLKLLPFNILPSAWDKVGAGRRPGPGALPAPDAATAPVPETPRPRKPTAEDG